MGTNKYNDDWGKVDETPVDVVDNTTPEPSAEEFNEPIDPPKGLWGWLKRVLNF